MSFHPPSSQAKTQTHQHELFRQFAYLNNSTYTTLTDFNLISASSAQHFPIDHGTAQPFGTGHAGKIQPEAGAFRMVMPIVEARLQKKQQTKHPDQGSQLLQTANQHLDQPAQQEESKQNNHMLDSATTFVIPVKPEGSGSDQNKEQHSQSIEFDTTGNATQSVLIMTQSADVTQIDIAKQISQPMAPLELKSSQESQQSATELHKNLTDSAFRNSLHEIGTWLQRIRGQCYRMKLQLIESESYRSTTSTIYNQAVFPIWRTYQSLPSALTDMKYEVIEEWPVEKRMNMVSVASILYGLLPMRSRPLFAPGSFIKRTLAANVLGYFLFVPEVASNWMIGKISNFRADS